MTKHFNMTGNLSYFADCRAVSTVQVDPEKDNIKENPIRTPRTYGTSRPGVIQLMACIGDEEPN